MAVFRFSALSDGQSLVFNPTADVLNFDQTTVAAADLRVTQVGANIRIDVVSGTQAGKDVTLQNVSPLQLATTNVTFADGSKLLFGDDSTAQNDNLANSLTGTAGRDLLQGFGGADTMAGGTGNDTYIVSTGDVLSDTGGVDTVVSDITWALADGFENLTLTGTGNINATGNNAANVLTGNSGNNFFNPRGGDDTIQAGAGNDQVTLGGGGVPSYGNKVIDLGAGIDRLDFSGFAKSAIVVDLAAGTLVGGGTGGAGSAKLISIETVVGDGFDDRISGSAVAESLNGGGGNDTIDGRGGNDTLTGGLGADTFAFSTAPAAGNADQLTDFVSATDKLSFDNAVFTGLGATGDMAGGDARFASGAGLTSGQDASDRLVYNTTTGDLFYDADGNGAGQSVLVAHLTGAPTLFATDITVLGPANTIQGTAGNDSLTGTAGNDSIAGLAGNDTINGLGGNDTLDGGDGDDSLNGGGAGADLILGGNGNDTLVSSVNRLDDPSTDTLDGGLGNDTYDLRVPALDQGPNVVIVDAGGIDTVLSQTSFTLPDGIENLTLVEGTFGTGNALDNVIVTLGNEDGLHRVNAMGGNDTIIGGSARDEMTGGAGNDVFAFTLVPDSLNVRSDQIEDFTSSFDRLQFDNAGFTQIGPASNFTPGDPRFVSGAGLTSGQDASDRLIYDSTNGDLYYDADGNGAGASVLVAHLTGAPLLVASDIRVTGQSQGSTIQGTAGNDSLAGTEGNDSIAGLAGNDTLDGLRGDDRVDGGTGNDVLVGSQGADLLSGGDGDDTLNGVSDFFQDNGELTLDQNGQPLPGDTLDGGLGNDVFYVQFNDVIVDAGGIDTVFTDQTVYTLPDGFENLTYQPFGFSDGEGVGVSYVGNALDNTIRVESLWINSGADIDGGDGDDLLIGGASNDALSGGRGNDTLMGAHSDFDGDSYDGGDGDDRLVSVGSYDTLSGGNGADSFVMSRAPGGDDPGAPRMISDFVSGTDKIVLDGFVHPNSGSSGNFTADDARFFAAPGATTAHDATDRVIYNTSTGELFYDADGTGAGAALLITHLGPGVRLVATDIAVENGNAGIAGTAGDDSLTGSEGNDSISGLAGNDTLNALGGDDTLDGGDGNDSLIGGDGFDLLLASDGNDTLDGGVGNDTLAGGAGADSFIFSGAGAGTDDRVVDFATGLDRVHLDASVLTGIGADGNFSAGDARFFAGAGVNAAHDADDRVVFNTSTGQLWYDGDGTGAGDPALIGTFTSGSFAGATATPVNAADIVVDNGSGQTINGTAGNDSLTGTNGTDSINGLAGNDTINALGGKDTIDGGTGADSMIGGLGDDSYLVDNPGDVTVEQAGGGVDTVNASVSCTLGAFVDRLTLVGNAAINGTGNEIDNVITGNLASNALSGGAGNDILLGRPDEIDPFDNPSDGDDTLDGGAGNDSLVGGNGFDLLVGGDGNDTLNGVFRPNGFNPGEAAVDTMIGGVGDDVYWVDHGGDVLSDAGGVDTVLAFDMDWTLGAGFENLTLVNDVGEFGQTGIGNELDNLMSVTFADSRLEGRGGNDTLIGTARFNGGERGLNGGAGNDVLTGGGGGSSLFIFDQAPGTANADVITDFNSGSTLELDARVMTALGTSGRFAAGDARFFAAAGASSGHDADDRIVYNTTTGQLFYDADGNGAGAAQLVATLQGAPTLAATSILVTGQAQPSNQPTAGDDSLTGTEGNDSINGLAGNDTINALGGNDTIDGGSGADVMIGGAGDDLYFVDNSSDAVVESQNGGVDEVRVSVDQYTMSEFVNNGTLVGSQVTSLFGNAADNFMTASSVTQGVQLDGITGNDTLIGGSAGDELNGWQGNDSMVGGEGNDTFDGFNHPQDGADTMVGGTGDDIYFVDSAADVTVEESGGGLDTVNASVSYTLGAFVNNLALLEVGAINGTGNDMDNVITGNSAVNSLNGGLGNDTYVVSAGDVLSDSGGIDTVQANITWALADGFENLTLTGTGNINATGNNAANVLIGNSGNNFFNPRGGDDTIQGGAGNDQVTLGGGGVPTYGNKVIDLGAGFDRLDFSGFARSAIQVDLAAGTLKGGGDAGQGSATLSGIENVVGDGFNDRLSGSAVAESLNGGGGNDTIDGRGGNDTLTGGTGADAFVFDTGPAAGNVDQVTDFVSATDRLNFDNATFTALGADGNFAAGDARFAAGAGFTSGRDASDRIVYDTTTGNLYYDADGSGAGAAQLVATLQGHPALAATDIAVI